MRKFVLGALIALLVVLGLSGTITSQKANDSKDSKESSESTRHLIKTKHYSIDYHGPKADAEQAGKILEAAWEHYKGFFGAEPKLEDGKLLRVIVHQDRETFLAAVGRSGDDSHVAGIYNPNTEVAHLYNYPTTQGRHEVLLHECAHQFHYLSRMGTTTADHDWLIEGIAELLCYHHWDGKKLEMLVMPIMTAEDHFSSALKAFKSPEFKLSEFLTSSYEGDYDTWHAFASWLQYGDKGKNAANFAKLAREVEAEKDPIEAFKASFGDVDKAFASFLVWLEENQEHWSNEFPQWQSLGNRSLRGISESEAMAALKHDASEFETVLLLPDREEWLAGIVLNWIDDRNHVSVNINHEGLVVIQPTVDNVLEEPIKVSMPKPRKKGQRHFKVVRNRGDSVIYVDKREVKRFHCATGRFGLSVTKGSADFTEMKWKLVEDPKKTKK
ncbi:MAG: hypothetical protein KDB07_10405 [Planctomycetes bacterium]|nr:hypothetical protein [Planctomycetota bacterium]